MNKERVIYFAGGCFWGMEKLFSKLDGVVDTTVGYANGKPDITPTYEIVCQNESEYRECVKVQYDKSKITIEQLLRAFFFVVDPTLQNQQGNDVGTQYQTGIYYTNEDDCACITSFVEAIRNNYQAFYVEVKPLLIFVDAEEYHQDYLVKHPTGYCHIPSVKYEEVNAYAHQKVEKNL